MPEAVRLVIWDLDDTFWKGTVTEGGIKEYVRAHHDIVIELARRGIMSSICSKNDRETVLAILRDYGIADYFIFPSISWEPKGQRVASIVEAVQLRPATVLFVDDNPNNRAEVAAAVPGIQIADELSIAGMLDDPLFKGKDDASLSRLGQYKLLEKRKADEILAGGDNREFLRTSNVRVVVDADIAGHADRAIELINRTNQLNFTKLRLPDDIEEARRVLLQETGKPGRRSGLVRVIDNYGDYGFVGFFMTSGPELEASLIHYCFSCRTLGMGVESWFYETLGRPALTVVGDVLTDLGKHEPIDWIRFDDEPVTAETAAVPTYPAIRMLGGCEANAIAHYFTQSAPQVAIEANFASGMIFVRVNSSSMLLSASDRGGPEFTAEMERLGLPADQMVSHYFDPVDAGTLMIFSAQLDSGYVEYRHKAFGWTIKLEPDHFWDDLTATSEAAMAEFVTQRGFDEATASRLLDVAAHLRRHYVGVSSPDEKLLTANMREIFARIPTGAKLVVLAPGTVVRSGGKLQTLDWVIRYNALLPKICADVPFVRIVSIDDLIVSDADIAEGWNHYDRPMYFRIAQALLAAGASTPSKQAISMAA